MLLPYITPHNRTRRHLPPFAPNVLCPTFSQIFVVLCRIFPHSSSQGVNCETLVPEEGAHRGDRVREGGAGQQAGDEDVHWGERAVGGTGVLRGKTPPPEPPEGPHSVGLQI